MKKFTSLIALAAMFGYGQWADDYNTNTLVADAPTGDIQSIGTNDGKTYVIFWDESDGYDLRVQILDVDGSQLLGTNGILANDVADNGTWTATRSQAVDADGNLYIGFTATNDSNGYVNKISSTGEQLYGASGIAIENGWAMKVLPQSDGGVIVGWSGGANGEVMRYDATGTAVWDAPLQISSPDSGRPFTGVGEFASLSDGSFIVIFHTKPTGWSVDSIPFAQKYNADGEAVWSSAIQISTQTLMSNRDYPVLQDGDVTYFGYYGSTGWRFDSFLQRINADGTLPWGSDGSDFGTDDTYMEMNTSIAFEQGSDHIWAASNITDSNQNLYGLSVQKFNKETGEVMLEEFGKSVFPVNSDSWIHLGSIQLAHGNPLLLFSNGISNGVNSIQLGVALLDEEGEFSWEGEYKMIATSEGNKGRFDFTKNVDGQSVAVWTEEREGISKAYAQNIFIEEETSGVDDLTSASVSIYPNPTSGILHIRSEKPIQKAEIFSLNGQLLKQFKQTNSFNLSDLNKGIYLIKLYPQSGTPQIIKLIRK